MGHHARSGPAPHPSQLLRRATLFPRLSRYLGECCGGQDSSPPLGAARFCAYVIVSGLFDRYPNFRAAVAEVGHGWLPHWAIRLGQMIKYVSGSVPSLQYTPLEYVQQGRFKCTAEPFEGPEMTRACLDILGDGASDAPVGLSPWRGLFPRHGGDGAPVAHLAAHGRADPAEVHVR